ncbi:MAG: DNA polymerase III subunit delta [Gemmatimonadetes bacterium]|nr:DNA polymerase III subunit delta [Gemmatimonadota bacterium]
MSALDFDAFRRSLTKGEILPAYYFHGDENLLKEDAVHELLAVGLDSATREFNLDRRRAAELSAEEFEALVLTPPMLAARRIVVLSEVESLQQRRSKAQAVRVAVIAYLGRPSPQTLLVLVQSAGEKADVELARLAATVAFDPLPPERVGRWIRHRARKEGLAIEEDAVLHLQAVVGDDLAQVATEIAKLRAAVPDRAATIEDIANLVGVRRGETVYDFVDAVTARRFPVAAGMVQHLVGSPGNSGVRLISALAVALSGVALARAHLDDGVGETAVPERVVRILQDARPPGLRVWPEEARHWTRDAARWTGEELDAALEELLAADRRLKGTALGGDGEIVVEAVLGLAGRGRVEP